MSPTTQAYICGCFLALNWEYLAPSELASFLDSLPRRESQVEDIRIEGSYLKLQKNQAMLKISLDSHDHRIQENCHELNSYDRRGKG